MAEPVLDIAIKGGPDAATLENNNREIRYGFSGGFSGLIQRRLTDGFSLGGQVELIYTQRGAKAVFDGMTQGESRQHYFDIVLAAHPEIQIGPMNIYLLLGGSLDLLMSANKDNISGTMTDITDDLHRIDVALLGGIGLALRFRSDEAKAFRPSSIFLEARHDIGLLDTDAVNGGFKNRSSSLMLGLSFAVGGSPVSGPPR